MKQLLVLFLSLLCFNSAKSQVDAVTAKNNLMTQAADMSSAFKNMDLKKWATYIHPNLIKYMTEEKIVESTQLYLNEIKSLNTSITSIDVEIVNLVNADLDWQAIIKQTLIIETESGNKIKTVAYLFGESIDNAKTWKFCEAKNNAAFKLLIPHFNAKLSIPDSEEAILYK